MKRSTDRILTTHVGSLIRPKELQDFLRLKQAGKPYDQAAYQACLKQSVAAVVKVKLPPLTVRPIAPPAPIV